MDTNISDSDVKRFLAWLSRAEPQRDLNEISKRFAAETGVPVEVAAGAVLRAVDAGFIEMKELSVGQEESAIPHRRQADHHGELRCERCRVPWPCRSIVVGYDVAPSVATITDWQRLNPFRAARAQLVRDGLVEDTGRRRCGEVGRWEIVWLP